MRILMVVAKKNFRDEEFQVPYDHFKAKQIEVDIASTDKGECLGVGGTRVTAGLSFDEADAGAYSGIVIAGGAGAKDLFDDSRLHRIIRDAYERKIVVAAICIAPVILAKAGILKGKRATVWNEDNRQSPVLAKEGAFYVREDVVADGRVITADGPAAAGRFAAKVAEELGAR